eukprot:TRINITY_DN6554_c0_g1_i3.p1 TRINITY_DN6554_c0_g1~~TRINITY_DN6554_c0_g1_i3.p1  ORF type:complete len:473 (-),score=108.25 TRINITY_DN6554_c0_g1_i3:99-1316(-)
MTETLADTMVRTVDLVERGTQKMLDASRAPDANELGQAQIALQHVGMDLRLLSGVAKKLRGSIGTDKAKLKAGALARLPATKQRIASLQKDVDWLEEEVGQAEFSASQQEAALKASNFSMAEQQQFIEKKRQELQKELRRLKSRSTEQADRNRSWIVTRALLEKKIAMYSMDAQASKEKRADALEYLRTLQASTSELKMQQDARQKEAATLEHEIDATRRDTAELKVSIRVLEVQNRKYEAMLSGAADVAGHRIQGKLRGNVAVEPKASPKTNVTDAASSKHRVHTANNITAIVSTPKLAAKVQPNGVPRVTEAITARAPPKMPAGVATRTSPNLRVTLVRADGEKDTAATILSKIQRAESLYEKGRVDAIDRPLASSGESSRDISEANRLYAEAERLVESVSAE